MSIPEISVIITTKNESSHIYKCLVSVRKQSYKKIEIIVVDNNSTDGTKAIGCFIEKGKAGPDE